MSDQPMEYIFAITRPGGQFCTIMSDLAEPVHQLQVVLDEKLEKIEPGMWATPDRQTVVERLAWVPVGRLPEDHAGVGVAVVAVAP